jgi:hypothetical protein
MNEKKKKKKKARKKKKKRRRRERERRVMLEITFLFHNYHTMPINHCINPC